MNKYKKIFSGLGILSISTLIGAGVVACAKTKVEKEETPAPGTSDSKDLATIKNEASVEVEKLQGHEKYAELKAIIDKENATIEELNSAKTSAIEELNNYKNIVQTAIDSIKEETRKTELKTKLEAASTYKELKAIKDEISTTQSTPQQTPGEKEQNGDGMGTEDLTALKKAAIDAVEKIKGHSKYDELKAKVNKDSATKEELNDAKTTATNELNKFKEEIKKSIEILKDDKKNELKTELESSQDYASLKLVYDKILPLAKSELVVKIDSLQYPDAELSKPTKEKLKQNIENLTVETYPTENKKIDDLNDALKAEIKKIDELFNFSDLKQSAKPENIDPIKHKDSYKKLSKNYFKTKLNTLKTKEDVLNVISKEYETKFNKYKEIINDEFWGNYQNQSRLNGRLLNFYNEDEENKEEKYRLDHLEASLIFNVYETIRQRAYNVQIDSINKLSPDKKQQYKEKVEKLIDGKDEKFTDKNSKRFTHGKNLQWLIDNLAKLKTELENAKKEAKQVQTSSTGQASSASR
ncbi:hypothetical protein [Mycoplasmopsis cynos]|uniref:Lipoprotein n=1 Tax=Mycoplasmopsis cynos TaxID=171284 RepID=A0ABD8AI74_9BACT|nr:hypothetical protein [Mycoplasmopsis cynos]MCU9935461.1 hypothetical protein [Mycoplasmopsis cynos]WQQ19716.1 hypothetical protein RRG46_02595 [Mycoplasmopsis cynos]